MTIERVTVRAGLCPLVGKAKAVSYRTPSKEVSYEDTTEESGAEHGSIKVTVPLIRVGRQASDMIATVALCPLLQSCGCSYDVPVTWVLSSGCVATISWVWPERAGCLLKSGVLSGSKSGTVFLEELGPGAGNVIYRIDDDRNPECPGCGMAGADRSSELSDPVPGETFILTAIINEQSCISLYGEGSYFPIGSELFQTVGFMGGEITDILDEESQLYEVNVNGYTTGAIACDRTSYQVGDWVALAKLDTEFPLDEFDEREPVTDSNVPTVGIEEYVIVPYQFAGVT